MLDSLALRGRPSPSCEISLILPPLRGVRGIARLLRLSVLRDSPGLLGVGVRLRVVLSPLSGSGSRSVSESAEVAN